MNILIECHHLLGDAAIMLPMIQCLKKNMKESKIDMIVGGEAEKKVLTLSGCIDQFYYMNTSKFNLEDYYKLIKKLRARHYDFGFACVNTNRRKGAVLLKLAGCKTQIGAQSDKGHCYYSKSIYVSPQMHEAERNMMLLKGIGIRPDQNFEPISVCSPELSKAKSLVKTDTVGIISICIGTGDFTYREGKHKIQYNPKKWKLENWIGLSKMFEEAGYFVIFLGGAKEEKEIKEAGAEIINTGLFLNAVNQCDIIESLSFIALSHLCIGGDTGLMHWAAMMGIPTLSIFGATNPVAARPYSSKGNVIQSAMNCCPCMKTYGSSDGKEAVVCQHKKCLSSISAKKVFDKALQILA